VWGRRRREGGVETEKEGGGGLNPKKYMQVSIQPRPQLEIVSPTNP